jgi:hypothetical protein
VTSPLTRRARSPVLSAFLRSEGTRLRHVPRLIPVIPGEFGKDPVTHFVAALLRIELVQPQSSGLPGTLRWRDVRAVMQLGVPFIALSRKAQAAIEKLVQQAQQFHLAINFDRTMHGSLPLQECP